MSWQKFKWDDNGALLTAVISAKNWKIDENGEYGEQSPNYF